MISRLMTDEDFDNDIIRGIILRADLSILRVQDAGLAGHPDSEVLEHAAEAGRILLTHDVNTLVALAYGRVADGLRMPGLFAVRQSAPIGRNIEDILLLTQYAPEGEYEDHVIFVPL